MSTGGFECIALLHSKSDHWTQHVRLIFIFTKIVDIILGIIISI